MPSPPAVFLKYRPNLLLRELKGEVGVGRGRNVLVRVGFGIQDGNKRITLIWVLGESRKDGTYMLMVHPAGQVYVIRGLEIHQTVPVPGMYGHLRG